MVEYKFRVEIGTHKLQMYNDGEILFTVNLENTIRSYSQNLTIICTNEERRTVMLLIVYTMK